MLPYWLLFSIFALGSLLGPVHVRDRVGSLFVPALMAASAMIGFRFQVGGDWHHYAVQFNRAAYQSLADAALIPDSDIAYGLLNWIGTRLGAGLWFVNLVCASVTVWGLGKLALQQPRPWVFVLTATSYGLIVAGMCYTRQSAAIGLCAAAFAAFRDRGARAAIGYILIAALFHKTAAIMLPLILLAERNKPLITALYGLILAALLTYFMLAPASQLYDSYVGGELQSQGAAIRVAMTLLPALCFLLAGRQMYFLPSEYSLYRTLAIAGIVTSLSLIVLPSSTVVDRLNLYLIPFQSVIFSRLPITQRSSGAELAVRGATVAYAAMVLFVWLNYASNAQYWVPYRIYPLA